ncbi:MAG: HAD-IC family P-type ATPase [bacterium]
MDIFRYTTMSSEDIIHEFESNGEKGLSMEYAKKQLETVGQNTITSQSISWIHILIRQFKSAFIYLLLAASILTLVLGHIVDASMIFAFLFINAGFGFYQEYRSEKTIELLKHYIISYAKTVRNGVVQPIQSDHLVPGDIIVLETGDKIPADVRFIEANGFIVDESILTGESISIAKDAMSMQSPATAYYEARNVGFSGTIVLSGKARAIVVATGKGSAIGKISTLMGETKRVSNFEKNISQFSNFILKLVALTITVVFLANILIKGEKVDIVELLVFAIALTVSVIPEALPVVTTFSLSRGARRLAKQKVIVKRLSAVEDLGGIEILCSDKTGTLTENKLVVSNVYAESHNDTVLWYANLAGAFDERKKLEPFDSALWRYIPDDVRKKIKEYKKTIESPFNPVSKKNVVLIEKDNSKEIVVRGAPEAVFLVCKNIPSGKKVTIETWIREEGKKGRRVLAIAKKPYNSYPSTLEQTDIECETDFDFEGIISFTDPVKPSTYSAVKQAKVLGVAIKIITGDSKEVSGAVAYEIGLAASPEEVITATEWEALPQKQKLSALERYAVIARVSPEQKYAIIEALQTKYMVGFLGEGINDAPALKIAGVSLVVAGGSDIAREAADIILLKKNLKAVLDGIQEGREVFANTTKYIKATLISNFGNFFAIAIASLITDFLPMLPLQILLVNFLSDFPMIAISTDTVDSKELTSPKKYEVKDIVLFSIILGVLSTFFDFIFFGLFYRISPSVLQTNWFIGSILTELILLFSIRSKMHFCKARRPSATLLWLTSVAAIITVILPFTAIGSRVFSFVRPAAAHLSLIFGIVIIYFICSEVLKLAFYKRFNEGSK